MAVAPLIRFVSVDRLGFAGRYASGALPPLNRPASNRAMVLLPAACMPVTAMMRGGAIPD